MPLNNSLILDTSFFVALANPRDFSHQLAKSLAEIYSEFSWLTTWPVVTEVCHLVSNHSQQRLLQNYQEGAFEICDLELKDVARLTQLLAKYADHEIDLADLSLILVAEHLGHGNILTCDHRDFSILRWGRNKAFINLCAIG